jgi:hypothetical protein
MEKKLHIKGKRLKQIQQALNYSDEELRLILELMPSTKIVRTRS